MTEEPKKVDTRFCQLLGRSIETRGLPPESAPTSKQPRQPRKTQTLQTHTKEKGRKDVTESHRHPTNSQNLTQTIQEIKFTDWLQPLLDEEGKLSAEAPNQRTQQQSSISKPPKAHSSQNRENEQVNDLGAGLKCPYQSRLEESQGGTVIKQPETNVPITRPIINSTSVNRPG